MIRTKFTHVYVRAALGSRVVVVDRDGLLRERFAMFVASAPATGGGVRGAITAAANYLRDPRLSQNIVIPLYASNPAHRIPKPLSYPNERTRVRTAVSGLKAGALTDLVTDVVMAVLEEARVTATPKRIGFQRTIKDPFLRSSSFTEMIARRTFKFDPKTPADLAKRIDLRARMITAGAVIDLLTAAFKRLALEFEMFFSRVAKFSQILTIARSMRLGLTETVSPAFDWLAGSLNVLLDPVPIGGIVTVATVAVYETMANELSDAIEAAGDVEKLSLEEFAKRYRVDHLRYPMHGAHALTIVRRNRTASYNYAAAAKVAFSSGMTTLLRVDSWHDRLKPVAMAIADTNRIVLTQIANGISDAQPSMAMVTTIGEEERRLLSISLAEELIFNTTSMVALHGDVNTLLPVGGGGPISFRFRAVNMLGLERHVNILPGSQYATTDRFDNLLRFVDPLSSHVPWVYGDGTTAAAEAHGDIVLASKRLLLMSLSRPITVSVRGVNYPRFGRGVGVLGAPHAPTYPMDEIVGTSPVVHGHIAMHESGAAELIEQSMLFRAFAYIAGTAPGWLGTVAGTGVPRVNDYNGTPFDVVVGATRLPTAESDVLQARVARSVSGSIIAQVRPVIKEMLATLMVRAGITIMNIVTHAEVDATVYNEIRMMAALRNIVARGAPGMALTAVGMLDGTVPYREAYEAEVRVPATLIDYKHTALDIG